MTTGLNRAVRVVLLAITMQLTASSAHASTFALFDGSLGPFPPSQGWLTYDAVGAAFLGVAPSGVHLMTGISIGSTAGFSSHTPLGTPVNPAYPTLSALSGFQLDFTVEVATEFHFGTDRAGFSVIALDSAGFGIELGFWRTAIFAQEVGFTHAEDAAFSTQRFINYSLRIFGNSYELTGNGSLILAGPTRNYAASGGPYNVPGLIFFGDNTPFAQTQVSINEITLITPDATTVPEPSTLALGVLGLAALISTRRSRRVRE